MVLNRFINIQNNIKTKHTSLFREDEISNDSTKIADELNQYFSTVASKLRSNNEGHNFTTKYLTNNNEHSFFIKPTYNLKLYK